MKYIIITVILALACQIYAQVPTNGLVAYYPLNGNAIDASGNGNNGTINGGVTSTTDRFGITNMAMQFNGYNGYILVNSSTSFPSTAITTAFWLNRKGLVANGLENYICKEHAFSTYIYPNAEIVSQVWKGSAGQWTEWTAGSYTVPMDNEWIFYASTFDNFTKIVRIYINGGLVNTINETNPNAIVRTSSSPLYIGRNGSSSVYFIKGVLDDLRLYNRALSSIEIQQLYNEQSYNSLNSGLVAHYPFDNNFLDYSENGYDGTQSGGVSFTSDHLLQQNGAASFDGQNDQVNITPSGDLLNYCAGNHSYSAWIKLNSVPAVPKFVVDASGVGTGGDQRGINFSGNNYPGFKWVTTTSSYTVYSTQPLTPGVWYHIAGKLEGNTGKIYVNGVLKGTLSSTGTPTSIFNFKIGNISGGGTGNGFFNGNIDDLRVYKRALSEAEIRNLAQANIPLSVGFIISDMEPSVNEAIQLTVQSEGNPPPNKWTWNFGDNTPIQIINTPASPDISHTYSQTGLKEIKLTVENGTGISLSMSQTVQVSSNNKGIDLEIIETGGTNDVAFLGYFYEWRSCSWCLQPHFVRKIFPVEIVGGKRMAYINEFEDASTYIYNKLISDFNDTIYLYDATYKQLGHIAFQYDHSLQGESPRNAIIFFHNDNEMKVNPENTNKPFFPYSTASPEYKSGWNYYKIDEYPVSMLIPPNNSFPSSYNKPPVILVQGVSGTYSYSTNPNADFTQNDVSYWYTTPRLLNEKAHYDAWQYYYPYDTDIEHLGIGLKPAIDSLKAKYNQKIRIVTHSMGGLVTIKYLTKYSNNPNYDSREMIEKVLFTAPPMHGSYSANRLYRTAMGTLVEYFANKDKQAPAYRDLSLGSKFVEELNSGDWTSLIDLNGNDTLSDDYFALLGTTEKYHSSSSVHEESYKHSDGVVSISSASLLDHGIGFATIHGNHDDCNHGQSKNKKKYNIGLPDLIPEIIDSYFFDPAETFYSKLQAETNVRAVVKADMSVFKPSGATLATLNNSSYPTGEQDVNYQKGLLLLNIGSSSNPITIANIYTTRYNETDGILKLYPSGSYLLSEYGYTDIGFFVNNSFNDKENVYYFRGVFNNTTERGCAIYLSKVKNTIKLMDFSGNPIPGMSNTIDDFKYCYSNTLTLGTSGSRQNNLITNNRTDTKFSTLFETGAIPSDNISTSYFIDDQTSLVKFELSSKELDNSTFPLNIKLQIPDGTIIDSSYAGGNLLYDSLSGSYEMSIADPMFGKWKIWAESNQPGIDTISYAAFAYLKSDIYAYLINDTSIVNVGDYFNIEAGLQLENLNLSDSLNVWATITQPEGDTSIYNLSSSITAIDTAFKFIYPFQTDTSGYYTIKLNFEGVYNGYRFERVLFHQFGAADTTIVLKLPDITLRQNHSSSEIRLREYAYNYTCPYDSLLFETSAISSNIGPNAFLSYLNDTTWTHYFNSSLSDTGSVVIQYTMLLPDNNIIYDTILIHVVLPDLAIINDSVNQLAVCSDSALVASFQLKNQGNTYSNALSVKYFLSSDLTINSSDLCLKDRVIYFLERDSLVNISDSILIPSFINEGLWNLIIAVDPDGFIKEVNDSTNNVAILPLTIQKLSTLNVKLYLEGLYNAPNGSMNQAHDEDGPEFQGLVADLVTIRLANALPPYAIVKTFEDVEIGTNGIASVVIPQDLTGIYYIVINHRNSIETWSAIPVTLNSPSINYDFTTDSFKAYGNNMRLIGINNVLFTGDVTQDGVVDIADMTQVDNDSAVFMSGYLVTDINGDGIVDTADMSYIDNNSFGFVGRIIP
ncbi:Concanavalin A-like lectin [Lentimicrobium saccharophilum]|uniref:Concanavalin A-like lectin n=1 Tax=Lentimicrobium saccharophilum TaxID=1678841 RepID=A0A0S7BWJ0_9BACT|nr:LamG-like jellyroll fold domain-containing protein [Lentimicrobium saccharophilum]GAP41889.1 Concanavalin A-like lectin [Lentimicrobium saccharophilum]